MSKKKQDENGSSGASATFEQALARLEQIVADMESGKLNLDDMVARFEEGQKLIKLCSARLNEVERKVEVLVKEGDEVVARPIEAEASDEEADAPAAPGSDQSLPF